MCLPCLVCPGLFLSPSLSVQDSACEQSWREETPITTAQPGTMALALPTSALPNPTLSFPPFCGCRAAVLWQLGHCPAACPGCAHRQGQAMGTAGTQLGSSTAAPSAKASPEGRAGRLCSPPELLSAMCSRNGLAKPSPVPGAEGQCAGGTQQCPGTARAPGMDLREQQSPAWAVSLFWAQPGKVPQGNCPTPAPATTMASTGLSPSCRRVFVPAWRDTK